MACSILKHTQGIEETIHSKLYSIIYNNRFTDSVSSLSLILGLPQSQNGVFQQPLLQTKRDFSNQ